MSETDTTANVDGERREFKAEIKKLLDILIHSVYTSKDVFVRELISNAADALEKARFRQASGETLQDSDLPLEIGLETNEEDRILVITDTGIGMTADEVDANIGTIAHSGATAFLEQLQRSKQSESGAEGEPAEAGVNLIGRFGVGFYSVFMAAEKVVLTSRSADPDAAGVVWTSDGAGEYTLAAAPEEQPRGTRIEVHLKKESDEFVDASHLKSIVQRYSNFVPFPIKLNGEQVNRTTALWREPASQVKDEDYNEFYKLVSHDYQDPLLHLHHSVDAPLQFKSLLYVPQTSPEAMGFGEGEVSVQLYVQRVLIDGDNQYCLPKYLRFVKGVVESEDLPLNVSRETFQHNRMIAKIRDILTRKLLDRFLKLAEDDEETYNKFWQTFNRILKEGYSDHANKDRFQDLLRFNSSRHDDEEGLVSLKQYVETMPEGQKAIYFLTGPTREALQRDPRLELFRKHRLEVLYLYEAA
ncbi:MAG: molecular chaperone HtpG, partial [Planctomycetales bacterium]|nr:molecular chaperone HtpG [Planctomycetales bacterium]